MGLQGDFGPLEHRQSGKASFTQIVRDGAVRHVGVPGKVKVDV